MTVSGRPIGRLTEDSSIFFHNGYSMFCLFLVHFPTAHMGLLVMFSSPINSETIEKSIKKFKQAFISLQQDLIKF